MTILLQYDSDQDAYELWCASPGMSAMPAGGRLFHPQAGVPIPPIQFSHATKEAAEGDAALLRAYLGSLPAKRQTKRELREAGV